MNIYLGDTGLKASWQEPFKKTIKCKSCKGNCRIMFTIIEDAGQKKYIADLHENMKNKKYWFHDACAVSVYLCEKCFEINGEANQA
jgi:hypothetical protein